MTNPPETNTGPVPIDRLDAHPANSNVMPRALLKKLSSEIRRTGLYPLIIARPLGDRYQVLDGHHRLRVLKELGYQQVQVTLWHVDDEQALVLLATLNRMRGEDDPRKRAALVATLGRSMGANDLAKRLPEDGTRVRKLLALHAAPPPPLAPTPLSQVPVCVSFFLLPGQRRALERRLREFGPSREAALLTLLNIPEEVRDE